MGVERAVADHGGAPDVIILRLEGPVRGDQGRATFVALAEHFEEELGTRLGERHEAQLIDDQQFVAGDLLRTYLLFVAFATVIIGHTRKGISA